MNRQISPQPPRRPSRAFTLVELLVVIAIIGILVALLLPAVQAAREAARRTQCSNHLKQIGLALHNYHSSHRSLPYGSGYTVDTRIATWVRAILPYLEQQPLFDSFDISAAINHAKNTKAVTTPVAALACPSDPSSSNPILDKRTTSYSSGNPGRAMGLWYVASIGPTAPDYCRFGADTTPGPTNPTCKHCNWGSEFGGFCEAAKIRGREAFAGMFGRSIHGLAFSDVRDGLSNTIMVGETLPGHNGYNCAYCPNFPVATTNVPLNHMESDNGLVVDGSRRNAGFKSMHPGGAQFVFGDGGVRHLSTGIDYFMWNYLGDRNSGQVVELP